MEGAQGFQKKKTKNKIDRYLRRAATRKSKFAANLRRLMAEEWNNISPKRMGARLQHNAVYFLRGKNTKKITTTESSFCLEDCSGEEAEAVPQGDVDEGDCSGEEAEAVVGEIQDRLLGLQEQVSRLKTLCFPEDPSRDWEEVILSAVRGPGCQLVKNELRKVGRHLRTIENGIDVFLSAARSTNID